MFMDRQVNARVDVGLVVALVEDKSGIPFQTEWEDWDADFVHIKPRDARQAFAEFQKIVSAFAGKNPRRSVAVFCRDGFNLTGYCIASYLHQANKVSIGEAIRLFSNSRPPGIYHKPLLDDLHDLFGGTKPTNAPETPEWADLSSPPVPPHGDFALPAARPRLATPPEPKPSASQTLPAGWSEHWSKTHNKKYYFCKATGKQSWDFPTEAAPVVGSAPSSGGGGPEHVTASHILVKFSGSRNPTSWRDEQGAQIRKRTLEQAKARVEELRREVVSASDPRSKFAEIARKESDCSSAKKGGDLGKFGRGKMQPPFEKAAFATPIGKISDLVVSDSGVHIILRTA